MHALWPIMLYFIKGTVTCICVLSLSVCLSIVIFVLQTICAALQKSKLQRVVNFYRRTYNCYRHRDILGSVEIPTLRRLRGNSTAVSRLSGGAMEIPQM